MLKEDQPLLLVACPMCGPFSTTNELNYAHMSEQEIKEKLHEALLHIRFALSFCLQQYYAGRPFLFKHPAVASSWGTTMMTQMLYLAQFGFCQLGVQVNSGRGKKTSAKKRTEVMTNSKYLAATLRLAQCDGSHRHEHLVGGNAKACEAYPEKFARLIAAGVQQEKDDTPGSDKATYEKIHKQIHNHTRRDR